MTKNFKTLLKTTAAVATLMMGSQTWGAELRDFTGTDLSSGNIAVTSSYDGIVSYGAATDSTGGSISLQEGGKFFIVTFDADGSTSMALTHSGATTLAKDASIYLLSHHATTSKIIMSGSTFAPSSVTGVNIFVGGAVTLPDLSSFKGVNLHIMRSLTLTGHANGIGGLITIPEGVTLTPATITKFLGGLSGAGSVVGTAITEIKGPMSGFTGSCALIGSAVTIENPPYAEFTAHQNTLTFTNGGKVKKITNSTSASTLVAKDTLTIDEYDMTSQNVTFTPPAGKKLTVTKLTQASAGTQTVTVSASAAGSIDFKSEMLIGGTFPISSKATIKKLTASGGTPVLNANEDITIDELNISSLGIELNPAAGRKITIKKVVGNSDITVNGDGEVVLKLPTAYSGAITTTKGFVTVK